MSLITLLRGVLLLEKQCMQPMYASANYWSASTSWANKSCVHLLSPLWEHHVSNHKWVPGPLRSPWKQTASVNATSSHQSSQTPVTIEEAWRLPPSNSGHRWSSGCTLDATLPRWGVFRQRQRPPCGGHQRNDVTTLKLP